MPERDWQDSDYVRVYQSIRDDRKFDTVRDDDRALAAWLRLLMDADLAYPVRPSIPASLSRYARKVLSDAGLVTFTGTTFVIHALKSERDARGDRYGHGAVGEFYGHGGGRKRYPSDRTPKSESDTPKPESETGASSESIRSLAGAGAYSASVSDSEFSTEGGPGETNGKSPFMEAVAYIEGRTRRIWGFTPGSKVWETLEPDVRDFGWPAVRKAMEAEKTPFPDVGQLVFGASRRLHPISGGEKAAEPDPEYVKEQLAERRKARGHA